MKQSAINKVVLKALRQKANPPKKDFTEQFRSRWMRWLGAVCRFNSFNWVELLSANWICWVDMVHGEMNVPYKRIGTIATREEVYEFYKKAIKIANLNLLQKLDAMWCNDNFEKRYNKPRKRK